MQGLSFNQILLGEERLNIPTNLETSVEVLNILTSKYIPEFNLYDIDRNDQIGIPDVIYLLLIKGQMIAYEIHQQSVFYYLLKTGRTFISIEENNTGFDFNIHPDGYKNHVGYIWRTVPYLFESNKPEISIMLAENSIEMSFFGMLQGNNGLSGSFNMSLSFCFDDNLTVSGEGALQVMMHANDITESIPLYLFDIISSHINPVRVSGKTAEHQIAFDWIADKEPDKTSEGFSPLIDLILAGEHSHISVYPDLELTLSSVNSPLYFKGQYHFPDQLFTIKPFIFIKPGQHYYTIDYFIKSVVPDASQN